MTAKTQRVRPSASRMLSNSLDRIILVITVGAAGALVLLVTATAILRHVFSNPIPGSLGIIALYLMPSIIFLGLPLVQKTERHIRATVLVERMRPVGQKISSFVTLLVSAVIVAVMLWGAVLEFSTGWDHVLPGYPPLLVGPSWLIAVIGLALLLLRVLVQLMSATMRLLRNDPVVAAEGNDFA